MPDPLEYILKPLPEWNDESDPPKSYTEFGWLTKSDYLSRCEATGMTPTYYPFKTTRRNYGRKGRK